MTSTVNDNSGVYYRNTYWNDIPLVYKYICKNVTGNSNKWWVEDFKNRFAKTPFKNALFINCGNGRIEREFIDKKIVIKATAFDYSQDLLEKAEKLKKKRNITYFAADSNTINLNKDTYDLIVNVAGLHHIQYINRFMYQLAGSLKKNGVMVNFDYVGPHRNQYSPSHWKLVQEINTSLPHELRHTSLFYPSVPVMLKEDPTEAIHSELIVETLARYFDIIEKHDTGGGLAYLLFTHNKNLFSNLKSPLAQSEIKNLLSLDKKLSHENKLPHLFSYFIATPNWERIRNQNSYGMHQANEDRREFFAGLFGNIYRLQDIVSLILFTIKSIVKKIIKINHA